MATLEIYQEHSPPFWHLLPTPMPSLHYPAVQSVTLIQMAVYPIVASIFNHNKKQKRQGIRDKMDSAKELQFKSSFIIVIERSC